MSEGKGAESLFPITSLPGPGKIEVTLLQKSVDSLLPNMQESTLSSYKDSENGLPNLQIRCQKPSEKFCESEIGNAYVCQTQNINVS
jgi:hypothetical protein